MKTLGKILGIGLFSLTSLLGCTKQYNIDGKMINYTEGYHTPMIIYSDSSKTSYEARHTLNDLRITGKDISAVKIAKVKKPLFPQRTLKYQQFPKTIFPHNKKDSLIFDKKIKEFDYYLNKIDSIENSKNGEIN